MSETTSEDYLIILHELLADNKTLATSSALRGFTLFTTFHDPHNYVHGTGSCVMPHYTTSCFMHVIMHWEDLLRC